MPDSLDILIPIYDGVTQLDFTGPHQFFCRPPGWRVTTASVGGRTVEADGLRFCGLAALEAVEACDVLCVPGGVGCTNAIEDAGFMAEIRRLAPNARYLTSVCTGSLILGAAGLLRGKRAACHWAWRSLLPLFGAFPEDGRVVRDGQIITGGGVTAGIDLALTVIAEIAGRSVAEGIQLALEYAPQPPFESGRPELAAPSVRDAVTARMESLIDLRRSVLEKAACELETI